MKKTTMVLLAITILALSSLACSAAGWAVVRGSGNVEEKTYSVSGFDGVALAAIGTVYVEIGEDEGLRVEAEDNLLEHFRIEVRGDTLNIETNEFVSLLPTKPVKFYLTAKALNAITVSGSGDVEAPALEADSFSIKVSGSGDIWIDELAADGLDADITGAGNVTIAGGEIGDQYINVSGSGSYKAGAVEAREALKVSVRVTGSGKAELGQLEAVGLDVDIAGAGKVAVAGGTVGTQTVDIGGSGAYRAADLESAQADLHISGSGSARVWASEYLDARITGSGDVYYKGDPTVTESITGSGDIRSIEG
jgi:hypothetical protein